MAGRSFMDLLGRFTGTDEDYAAGVAAHVLRRSSDPTERAWFVGCLRIAAQMLEDNEGIKIPALEFPSKTVRRIIQMRSTTAKPD